MSLSGLFFKSEYLYEVYKEVGTIYSIFILDEPESTVYEKLIDYALAKSDAFMLITSRQMTLRQLKETGFKFSLAKQADFENEMKYKEYLNNFKEFEKEILVREQIFEESAEPFLQRLRPYLIKERHKPTEWPSTKFCSDSDSDKTKFDINVYKVCKQVRRYLMEPNGLFHWIYPYFPEDLCFFKDGYCWLSTSAHERDAEIYTNNEDEVQVLKNLGLKFKYKEQDIKMFHEEYHTERFRVL